MKKQFLQVNKTGVVEINEKINNITQIPNRSYNDLQDLPLIPTNNNQLINGAGYITASQIPTDANSVVEVINANFNTNTNTPVPTIVGDDIQDTAHLICNNGSAYFNWNGTAWIFVSFIAKAEITDLPLIYLNNQTVIHTGTNSPTIVHSLDITNIKNGLYEILTTCTANGFFYIGWGLNGIGSTQILGQTKENNGGTFNTPRRFFLIKDNVLRISTGTSANNDYNQGITTLSINLNVSNTIYTFVQLLSSTNQTTFSTVIRQIH